MATDAKELQEFSNAISAYINFRKIPVEKAMGIQGRLLLKNIIAFTPPKTLKQGRDRVRKDILKSVALLDPVQFGNQKIKSLIAKRKDSTLTKVFSRFPSGKLRGVKVENFGSSHIKQHQRSRDKRGRVRRKINKVTVATTDKRAVNAYVRRVQQRVGMAKGGWAKAYIALGGRPAGWYARHSNQGIFRDESKNKINPYILIRNKSPWAGPKESNRIVQNAISARTRAIKFAIAKAHETAIKSRLRRLSA